MENCIHLNSGTESHIHFKLGTDVDHPSCITWHDPKVQRSKVKVTRSRNYRIQLKKCNNSVLLIISTSFLGVNISSYPQLLGYKLVVNAGCLETRNLQFIAAYFKNAKAYKLPIGPVYSGGGPGHVTQFWCKLITKDIGHTCKYAVKIYHNSVLGGPTNFILGG